MTLRTVKMCEEELIRIPCIKKEAAPTDCMDLERGRKQIPTIHATVDPVCGHLDRTSEKRQNFQRKVQ